MNVNDHVMTESLATSKTKKTLDVKPPKKPSFTIETDDDFLKLHTLTLVSGKRGGGKSVATANYMRLCKEKQYFQRCWLITPTYASNKEIWNIADIQEDDVLEPTVTALREIIKLVEAEKQEWELFLQQKELYEKFHTDMKHKAIKNIKSDQLMAYYEMGLLDDPSMEKPKWKHPLECPPRLALIIDDCLGTDLMARRTAGLVNTAIKHRHLSDGLGLSIFMLVQSYCAQGGCARPIRENATSLWLFKINDYNQIKKIKEEADLPVSDEDFEKMCNYCHEKPYGFIICDFNAKSEDKRFRCGFDEYLHPPSLNNKELIKSKHT
tara:strand:+ start:113 stop:1081 length:969 start_codon:yes stop_codon:yes gene_type:complete